MAQGSKCEAPTKDKVEKVFENNLVTTFLQQASL